VIVVLWRAGLRISEALALSETDLDPQRGAILVRRGKGGKRREVGMESTKSTEAYLHSNTTIKQEAIDKIAPIDTPLGRYKPSDKLLAFLESL
jgi:site-specific recombinase XerD